MPMLRAVPITIRSAASTLAEFRSGALSSAISRTWASVTAPTLVRFGTPEPFARPAARLSRMAAGGVLVMNVKERSLYTVMTTGITSPAWCWVRALNCLQNSMMLMPCWPSAGPTGGAGVALPALHCSFTIAWMRLAIENAPLNGLNLKEVQLHRRCTAEDAHHDLDLAPLVVDFVDDAREGAERTVHHADVIADPERHARDRLGLGRLHLPEDAPDLVLLQRDRALTGADEARHAGDVLHQVARLVVQLHLDHHVGREGLPLRDLPLPVLHLGVVLGRDEDLAEMVLERRGMDRLLEIRLHL